MSKQEADNAVATLQEQAPWLMLLEARSTGTSWFVFAFDTKQQRPIEFNRTVEVERYLNARSK